MDQKQRDEILWRLDERTKKVDDHLNRLDERLEEAEKDITKNSEEISDNSDSIELIAKTTRAAGALFAAVISGIGARLGGIL